MFERFTERARQVVVVAQDEARGLGHAYIGTEHLLLGLLREHDGIAAQALASFDVAAEEVRGRVERIVGRGESSSTGQIPFTPRAKRALELGVQAATAMNHGFVGTEHLLLGLTQDDGVAAQVLAELGAEPRAVRERVLETLGVSPGFALPENKRMRKRMHGYRRRPWWMSPQISFLLGALVLGAGVAIGWAISH